jgi:hypothetical protein
MASDIPLYGETNDRIIANSIYHYLCALDKEDTEAGIESA